MRVVIDQPQNVPLPFPQAHRLAYVLALGNDAVRLYPCDVAFGPRLGLSFHSHGRLIMFGFLALGLTVDCCVIRSRVAKDAAARLSRSAIL